jgi:hypothetical protein
MKLKLFIIVALLSTSFYAQNHTTNYKKEGNNPLVFIDSVNVDIREIVTYDESQVAIFSKYDTEEGIRMFGDAGKDGAVFIESIAFATVRYKNFFKSKSADYTEILLNSENDNHILYILNDEILNKDFEGNLALIDDVSFKNLKIISKEELQKKYYIMDKEYGVEITSNKIENP